MKLHSMDAGITYQPYSPGDEEGIIELLCLVFPKWNQLENALRNWRWKHLEGPHPSEVYVVKDGEKIVAVNHRIVLDIKIGDSIIKAGYGDEVAVHPDYRGQGIWKNLRMKADEKNKEHGIQFDYLATENPIVKENIVKMGYTPHIYSLTHLLMIRDQEAFLKRKQRDDFVTRIGVKVLTMLSGLKNITIEPYQETDFSIIDIDNFDEKIDLFWVKVKDSLEYCIVKNSTYLNWKCDRPTINEVKIRVAMSGDEILGFIVLGLIVDEDYREGSILELLTLPDRSDVVHSLIDSALEYYTSEDVAAVLYQVTKGHPHETIVKQKGFIDATSESNTFFFYRIIDKNIPHDTLKNLKPSSVQLNYF